MGAVVTFSQKGDFSKTKKYLYRSKAQDFYSSIERLAQMGVDALASATPYDTGHTASCWTCNVKLSAKEVTIEWCNSNLNNNWFPVAIMLQYGHGTGTGGFVQGKDYINPAIQPIMDEIADAVWKEVCSHSNR